MKALLIPTIPHLERRREAPLRGRAFEGQAGAVLRLRSVLRFSFACGFRLHLRRSSLGPSKFTVEFLMVRVKAIQTKITVLADLVELEQKNNNCLDVRTETASDPGPTSSSPQKAVYRQEIMLG